MVYRLVLKGGKSTFKKVKILWVSDTQPFDVFFNKMSLVNICEQLAKMGHRVTLVATRSKSLPPNRNSQVRMISIPSRHTAIIPRVVYALALILFLPFYLVLFKPDYIVTEPDTSIFGFLSVFPLSKLWGTKLILDIRSTPVETVGFRGFLQTFFFTISILIAKKFFNGMTIITPLMKKEICSKFNIDTKRVGVWTSGVSTTIFNPEKYTSEVPNLKRKLGLTGKFVVLYHGVFSENRGLIETIKAFSILKSVNSKVVLILLGTGPIYSSMKELIRMKKIQGNVIIHDSVKHFEVPKFIAMCDVGIVPLPDHPYWRFQSPLKLLEYLAMERLVILTDIPAHRFVIEEKKCGVYISSIAPIEIAKAIEYVYHNKEKMGKWGKIGRKIVKEEYTWNKLAKDLEKYLFSVSE